MLDNSILIFLNNFGIKITISAFSKAFYALKVQKAIHKIMHRRFKFRISMHKKGVPDKESPLWRNAGYIYETEISGTVTIFFR
jgi:hypothetical protein